MKVVTSPVKLIVGKAAWLQVVLVDATDFQTPETAIAYNASGMAVAYIPPGKSASVSKTLASGDWGVDNQALGVYALRMKASELTAEGLLVVAVKCTATDQTIVYVEVEKPRAQGPLAGAHDGGLT